MRDKGLYEQLMQNQNLVIKEFMQYLCDEMSLCKVVMERNGAQYIQAKERYDTLSELKDLMHQLLDKYMI